MICAKNSAIPSGSPCAWAIASLWSTGRTFDWIAGADNYVTLHIGPRELLLRQTLASVERQLDPERFTRIHRSAIVQLDRIASWRPATHGDAVVVLNNGVMLTLSRTWRARAERLVKAR